MLISLAKIEEADLTDQNILESLNVVARAYRLGHHNVFSPLNLLKLLAVHPSLSEMSRKMYNSMASRFSTSGSYLKNYTTRLAIVSGKRIIGYRKVVEKSQTVDYIEVSADIVCSSNILNKVVLLCENHRDTEFYHLMAKYIARKMKLRGLTVQFDPNGGGGNTTKDEYAHIQNTYDRLCLCILDSDSKYPGCSIGETAERVVNIDDSGNPFCRILTTNSMEVENLIPTQAIKDYLGTNNPLNVALKIYEKLDLIIPSRLYMDVKNGLKLADIFAKSPDSPYYKFWRPISQQILKVEVSHGKCPVGKVCGRKTCSCIVIPHLGSKILEQVLPFVERHISNYAEVEIDEIQQNEWDRLGMTVLQWCCGANQKAI